MLPRALLLALVALAADAAAPRPDAGSPAKGEARPQQISTAHFEVQFTVPTPVGKGYAALCERAYSRFCDLFDVPSGEAVWEGKCRVFLFATREQFVSFAAATAGPGTALSGGFASPTKKNPTIVMPMYGQDRVHLEQVLIHEMSHVFLQLYRKEVQLPTWLHEGCAQFFEFLHQPGDSRLTQWRPLVKALVSAGRERPLREFWVAAFPPVDRVGYAQAWSLIHCLSQHPRTRGKIGRFVLKLKELAPERPGFVHIQSEADLRRVFQEAADRAFQLQSDAFEQVFGMPVADFERVWKQFVLATY